MSTGLRTTVGLAVAVCALGLLGLLASGRGDEPHGEPTDPLQDQGDTDEARMAALEEAGKLRTLATQHHINGGFTSAIELLRKAIVLDPDHAASHTHLGSLLELTARPDEAIASYRRAIELKPGAALAHERLGHALKKMSRSDEAEKHLSRARELAKGADEGK